MTGNLAQAFVGTQFFAPHQRVKDGGKDVDPCHIPAIQGWGGKIILRGVDRGMPGPPMGSVFSLLQKKPAYPPNYDLSTGTDMRTVHLHLVSDAAGETVTSVARACMVQFEDVQAVQHNWWLIRTQGQVERVVAGLEEFPGIVMFTLVDASIRNLLEEACRHLKIPCIPVLDPVMGALASHLGTEIKAMPGRQYQLDAEYFARIDAMQFTLTHDDGQVLDNLEAADIVLVGVSRSSKTPTCMYLANRGYKCANYPLVPGVPLPSQLEGLKKPLVVGLTKDPKNLSDIRRARLRFLNHDEESEYAQFEKVREEVAQARRLFARLGWPVVDVTRRSIEEAAATIMQLHSQRVAKSEPGASE